MIFLVTLIFIFFLFYNLFFLQISYKILFKGRILFLEFKNKIVLMNFISLLENLKYRDFYTGRGIYLKNRFCLLKKWSLFYYNCLLMFKEVMITYGPLGLLVGCILFLGCEDLTICQARYFEPGISSIDLNAIEEAKKYALWSEDSISDKREVKMIPRESHEDFIIFLCCVVIIVVI